MATCTLVKTEAVEGIYVTEMARGEIAELLTWSGTNSHVGTFVQRCGDTLFALGCSEHYWSEIPWGNKCGWVDCRVRVLGEGEVLELRNERSER